MFLEVFCVHEQVLVKLVGVYFWCHSGKLLLTDLIFLLLS